MNSGKSLGRHRQAHDLDLGHQARNLAAAQLDTWRYFLTDEVQRDVHLDRLILDNALEIHVHDAGPGGVALHILENRVLALSPTLMFRMLE
jgi:hypothetical protein